MRQLHQKFRCFGDIPRRCPNSAKILPCTARALPQEKGIDFTVNFFKIVMLLEEASLSGFNNFIPNGLKKRTVNLAGE